MIGQTIIRVALVLGVGAGIAAAQSASMTLGTVRITQPVLAHGQPLPPGTYEVRLTDESLPPNPGQSPDAVRVVEFVKDGQVIARDAAEVSEHGLGDADRAQCHGCGLRGGNARSDTQHECDLNNGLANHVSPL